MIDRQGSTQATGIRTYAGDSSGNAGNVIVNAGILDIVNGGEVSSSTLSQGQAGNVTVTAQQLKIDRQQNGYFTGITSQTTPNSNGNAGNVIVNADSLDIINGGEISNDTFSQGHAGNVNVTTQHLKIDSQGSEYLTGIVSQVNPNSSGDAGKVTVKTGSLDIVNGGEISSNTFSQGQAGSVDVTAQKLKIDMQASNRFTGISASAKEGSGNGGGVVVNADSLDIINGGAISGTTWTQGHAGNVNVTAQQLKIDGYGSSVSSSTNGKGDAGNVLVNSGSLDIVNGGEISSNTWDQGHGGTVNVIADYLKISNQEALYPTGILADAIRGSSGNAGNVIVKARSLEIGSAGQISSLAWSLGHGGNVNVTSNQLKIDGQNGNSNTGIFADAVNGIGNAGDVIVVADNLEIPTLAPRLIPLILNGCCLPW